MVFVLIHFDELSWSKGWDSKFFFYIRCAAVLLALWNPYRDDTLLFKRCVDQVIRCVPQEDYDEILTKCHSSPYGGNYGGERKAQKVLQCGFFWLTLFKDVIGLCNNVIHVKDLATSLGEMRCN